MRNTKPVFIAISAASIGLVVVAVILAKKYKGGSMRISEKGLNLIKAFEGCRLNAYQDAGGVWTIGYGHTGDVYYGQTITQAEAEALLRSDVSRFENAVSRLTSGVNLSQNQFDALVSFAYNCGIAALQNSTLLRKVKSNPNDPTIADEFAKWVYVNKVKNNGLVNRRGRESNLYFS